MSAQAVRIARTELQRTIRSTVSSRTKLAVYASIALLVFTPFLLFGSLLSAIAGEMFASGTGGEGLSVTDNVVGGTAVTVLGLTIMAAIRTVTAVANPDKYEPAYLLISTRLRNVVSGLVLREMTLFFLWIAPVVVIFSIAFAWGASTPLIPMLSLGTLLVVLAVAIPVGFVVGIGLRHLLTVYEPISQYRTLLLVAFWGAYFLAVALGWFNRITFVLFEAFGDSPLGWPGQLLLVGLPGVRNTLWQAPIAVLGGVGVGLGALAMGIPLAERHWFADPARTDDETGTAVNSSDRLTAVLSGLSQPTRSVAVTTVRRAKRSPIRLAYVAYPLFGSVYLVEQIVRTGTIPPIIAVLLAVYVVWASGALFTLNILGDRGPALESVLISSVPGRAVVAGTVLACVLITLPFALVVPLAAGIISPLGLGETVLLTSGTLLGVLVAPLLATGIGSRFPRFGAVNVTRNTEAVLPSKTAFFLYTVAIGLPLIAAGVLTYEQVPKLLAGILSFLVSLIPGITVTIPEIIVTAVAALVVVVGCLTPFLSAWDAISRFDRYRPY